jgi:hypothetical protein
MTGPRTSTITGWHQAHLNRARFVLATSTFNETHYLRSCIDWSGDTLLLILPPPPPRKVARAGSLFPPLAVKGGAAEERRQAATERTQHQRSGVGLARRDQAAVRQAQG